MRLAAVAISVSVVAATAVAAQEFAAEKLRAHSDEFRREVIKVTDGVWVAVGFSNANSVLIEGEGGSIVVDTTSDVEDAKQVKAEFAKRSTAPVRAIIYTHAHPDHTGGASVFAGNDQPEILAHRLFVERVPDVGRNGPRRRRPVRLHPAGRPVHQRGHRDGVRATSCADRFLPPTRTFSDDRLELTIAGVRLQLLHTPGETRENIAVWLPDKRVLLPGDDFYKAFPTLYAIRGARLRPIDQWIASLGLMIDLGAELPGAGAHASGARQRQRAHGPDRVPRRHQVDDWTRPWRA